MNKVNGQTDSAAIDEQGQGVNLAELYAAAVEVSRDKYGKLEPKLFYLLSSLDSEQSLNVLLWIQGVDYIEIDKELARRYPQVQVDYFANGQPFVGRGQPLLWFALGLIAKVQPLPESVFPALVRAAVHETDLSLNEHFIGVACRFGPRRVAETLFEYAERGTEVEKRFAWLAFYWVSGGVRFLTEEWEELLAFYKTGATNPDYTDTVRRGLQEYYARLEYDRRDTII